MRYLKWVLFFLVSSPLPSFSPATALSVQYECYSALLGIVQRYNRLDPLLVGTLD